MSWIDQSFDEHTVAWLLLTSVIGGVVGAAITFVFDDLLSPWLTARRDARRVLGRYTMPLLRSSERLETRIHILIRNASSGWYRDDEYYRLSTLYVFAEYLGWVRNIEREFAFVRLESERRDREFNTRFHGFFRSLSSFSYFRQYPDAAAVSASELPRLMASAIGEVMTPGDSTTGVLDFSDFVDAYGSGPQFTRWFTDLDALLRRADEGDHLCQDRLIAAAANLRALCALLDPRGRYVRPRRFAHLERIHHEPVRRTLVKEFPGLVPAEHRAHLGGERKVP